MIIGCAAVLFNKEDAWPRQILLGLRTKSDGYGLWVLPGGSLERGEHPDEGVRRECREEVSVDPEEAMRVYFEYLPECKDGCLMLYYTDVIDPTTVELKALHEFAELKWFSVSNLPANMWDSDRRAVKSALAHWEAP